MPPIEANEIISVETMQEWFDDSRELVHAVSNYRIKKLVGSNVTLLKSNGGISFRHLCLKRAIQNVLCLNIPMPDEVFNLLNNAIGDDDNGS